MTNLWKAIYEAGSIREEKCKFSNSQVCLQQFSVFSKFQKGHILDSNGLIS